MSDSSKARPSRHVGLDVHQQTIAVAVAEATGGPAQGWETIANRPGAVAKLAARLSRQGEVLCFYYEAGPCGYGVYRQLTELGHACQVVAPSLIPQKPGDRVKTDRRDAVHLARLGRSGDLTAVWVPDQDHEAMRDLLRCRADAKAAQRQARQQLSSFLLRHGKVYRGGRDKWTKRYFAWLEDLKFDSPVQQIVFQEYVEAVTAATDRVASMDTQIQQAVQQWSLQPVVQALMALRGFDLLAASTMVAELGDLTRFDSPRQLMSYLGLTPSEHSSGKRTQRGGITKAGNGHARRMLTESAWTYRYPARKTKHLQRKAKHAPEPVQALAWKAQKRLCGRYRELLARGKPQPVVVTAIARELSGFIWAIYHQVMAPATGSPRPQPREAGPGESSPAL